MNLMNALGGISDRHIEEFAYVRPKKRSFKPWMMLASAACLVSVIVGVIVAVPKNKTNMPENSFTEFISQAYRPSVYFNDRMYGYYVSHNTNSELSEIHGHSDNITYSDDVVSYKVCTECEYNYGYPELPEGYVEVGEITTNDTNNSNVNGYAFGTVTGLKIGEKIYQDPENPEDLYVYTMISSDEKRYYHFVDGTIYESLRISGRTYVRDYSTDETFLAELPDSYAEVGEITTNDRKDKYADGFGRELYIGDKIYSSQENPDIVYVYTNRFSTPLCYVRYVAFGE